MYHIKEGSKTLCGKKVDKSISTISSTSASRATLSNCCPLCKAKYIEQLQHFTQIKEEKDG